MKGLKETYKRCADQIMVKPISNVSLDPLAARKKLLEIHKLISKPVPIQYSLPFFTFNHNQNSIIQYLGLVKKLMLDSQQKRTENLQVTSRRNNFQGTPPEKKPLPKLLYIQNPVVWLSNKIDFRFLRYSWDSNFSEEEFSRGARQAISTVTQMVSKNMFESLKPLLTKNALLNLRRDVEILWADEVRRNIGLKPEDVQLIIPRKIYLRSSAEPKLLNRGNKPAFLTLITPVKTVSDKRLCDIDVLFIGMKWLEEQGFNTPLVFVDIVSRFHRNYTEGVAPDWTISAFKVRRFSLIPQKS
ncbi:m-AAA protease-interacting protein 1, mitochondrial isoform X1 [Halyomorpha halys]|uniref:m-AAA protease-interacting protein 1, mitochondrial isoform X1 n=1 Tax=Halyomorpha halys TaxID=286706 RepID=UPI0006D5287B|nr:m-AAA protease-interacting protein 1, mitochondrial isoform X1 [Halyomorpha halys]XP_014280901.1 m-AAA protease-interacting protein 1, mitochondrial isoform X1 [Halyomorpha halys]